MLQCCCTTQLIESLAGVPKDPSLMPGRGEFFSIKFSERIFILQLKKNIANRKLFNEWNDKQQ